MKKQKNVKGYVRKTKNGKIINVKPYSAEYDSAEEKRKQLAKKKGAGDELENLKKKPKKEAWEIFDEEMEKYEKDIPESMTIDEAIEHHKKHTPKRDEWGEPITFTKKDEQQLRNFLNGTTKMNPKKVAPYLVKLKKSVDNGLKSPKTEKTTKSDSPYGFSADEYKSWYHWDQDADPKNKSALKVEKALKKQMGAKGYSKYFDDLTENYSERGHSKAFKGLYKKLPHYDSYTELKEAYKDYKNILKTDSSAKGKKMASQNLLSEMGISMQGADSKTKKLLAKIHEETGLDISKHKFYGKLPEAKEAKPTKESELSKGRQAQISEKNAKKLSVKGLRLNPSEPNEKRNFKFYPESGEVYGIWQPRTDKSEKRLTKFLNAGNRAKVAEAIENSYGHEAKMKFLEAAGVKDKSKVKNN